MVDQEMHLVLGIIFLQVVVAVVAFIVNRQTGGAAAAVAIPLVLAPEMVALVEVDYQGSVVMVGPQQVTAAAVVVVLVLPDQGAPQTQVGTEEVVYHQRSQDQVLRGPGAVVLGHILRLRGLVDPVVGVRDQLLGIRQPPVGLLILEAEAAAKGPTGQTVQIVQLVPGVPVLLS